jgi:hypothetical protein
MAKRDPKDIHIAAILYPNVIDSSYTTNKEKDEKSPNRDSSY